MNEILSKKSKTLDRAGHCRFFEPSLGLVFAVFVGIILILWPTAPLWSSLWIERLIFIAYSIIIFVILKKTGRITQEDRAIEDNATKKQSKFFKYLLLASVVILIITRLIPFIHWGETPLGYDTGFYLMRIHYSKSYSKE